MPGRGSSCPGHLDYEALDPGVPASFSHKIMVDLLRTSMGFAGVTITDALNMTPAMRWPPGEAAVRAFLAGNDILLMTPDLGAAQSSLLDAVRTGRISAYPTHRAVTRIVTLKLRLSGFPRPGCQRPRHLRTTRQPRWLWPRRPSPS